MENFCLLAVKVLPNASRTEVVGWLGEALKIRVQAPALEGRANAELCEFIAEILDVPKRRIAVAHGEKSRQKLLRVHGLDLTEAKARIDRHLGTSL